MQLHIRKVLISLVSLIAIVLLLPYLRYTAYLDPVSTRFAGPNWYNPYRDIHDPLVKANFHAHSRSWGGWTWGEDTAGEVISAYADKGYLVPALSNYQRISPRSLYSAPLIYVPVYEHGFNLRKVHCLCIGANAVSSPDYPWHFSIAQTRETIQRLQARCRLIALAHPGARQAHTPGDMTQLPALDLMEVINTMGARTAYWDSTLSAGNPIWLLANDDTHDLSGPETFMRWNMIYAASPSTENVLESLQHGNHYGVLRYHGTCEDNRLTEFSVHHDTLQIALRDTFNRLDLIGQDGNHVFGIARSNRAQYILSAEDTYIRAEVHQDHCVLYLNPVIRYDQIPPGTERRSMQIDTVRTWFGKSLVICAIVAVIWFWFRRIKQPDNV